jgi:hypothetical protein
MEMVSYRSLVLLLACLSLFGCVHEEVRNPPSCSVSEVAVWPRNRELTGVAGLDHGSILSVSEEARNRMPFAVLWIDDHSFASRTSGQSGEGETIYERSFKFRKEGSVDVKLNYRNRIWEDKPIEFKIDGKVYDLDRGNFFLISTQGESPRVLQTKRDIGLKGMRFDVESIQETAKTDEEIREFFTAFSAKKPEQ